VEYLKVQRIAWILFYLQILTVFSYVVFALGSKENPAQWVYILSATLGGFLIFFGFMPALATGAFIKLYCHQRELKNLIGLITSALLVVALIVLTIFHKGELVLVIYQILILSVTLFVLKIGPKNEAPSNEILATSSVASLDCGSNMGKDTASALKMMAWLLFFLQPVFWFMILFVMAADGGGGPGVALMVTIGILAMLVSAAVPGFIWAVLLHFYMQEKKPALLLGVILESFILFATAAGVLGVITMIITFYKLRREPLSEHTKQA